jgi:hypothetical protein
MILLILIYINLAKINHFVINAHFFYYMEFEYHCNKYCMYFFSRFARLYGRASFI